MKTHLKRATFDSYYSTVQCGQVKLTPNAYALDPYAFGRRLREVVGARVKSAREAAIERSGLCGRCAKILEAKWKGAM